MTLIKFATALAFLIGIPCALGAIVAVLAIFGLKEAPDEESRTHGLLVRTVTFGILPWAWLIARFWL